MVLAHEPLLTHIPANAGPLLALESGKRTPRGGARSASGEGATG